MTHRFVGLVLLFPVFGACAFFEKTEQLAATIDTPRLSAPDVRSRLDEFVDSFAREIAATSDAVVRSTEDRDVQRKAVEFKVNVISQGRRAAHLSDPRAACLDLWTFHVQLAEYFDDGEDTNEDGEGRAVMGDAISDAALRAVESSEQDLMKILRDVFGAARVESSRVEIEQFAQENKLRGGFGRRDLQRSATGRTFPGFGWIVDVPLAPFRAVAAIPESERAIHEFTSVADRFTNVVEDLPERTRWQLELALYDLEDRDTVEATRTGLAEVAESARTLTETARALPDELRTTLTETFEELESSQASLRTTVSETRGLVTDLDRMVEQSAETIAAADRAGESFAKAGEAWEGVFDAVGALGGDDAEAAPSSPDGAEDEAFDVAEYGAAAERIGTAAIDLKGAIIELRALLSESKDGKVAEAVDAATARALERTSEGAVDLVDHAAKRGAQLLGLAFVLGIVFRLIPRRWPG